MKSIFETKDILFLLGLELDLSDLFSLCSSSKKINQKLCTNEEFWQIKVRKDFGNIERHRDSYKDEYIYLKRVLSEKNLENLLRRYEIESSYGDNAVPLDIYDLIYDVNDDEGSQGFVEYNLGYADLEFEYNTLKFDILRYVEGDYDYEPGRTKKIIDDLTDGIVIGLDEEHLRFLNTTIIDRRLSYKDLNDFLHHLPDIINRMEKAIIKSTPKDIREYIRIKMEHMREMGDKNNDNIYNSMKNYYPEDYKNIFLKEDEIELIQLLHDAVKANKIHIFDPLDNTTLQKLFKNVKN